MSIIPLKSWNAVMNSRGNSMIEVNADWLFEKSKWRLCIIKSSYRMGAQHSEPFVICEKDPNSWIYGKPNDVRKDNSLIIANHLNSEELLNYLLKYQNDTSNEPRKQFCSILHKEFQKGNVSIASVCPIITEKQWAKRDESQILNLINETQSHLLKQKEKQLNKFGGLQAANIIEDLERELLFNFQHKMIKFVENAFYNKLNYVNKDKIMGASMNGTFATHLAPNEFKSNLKQNMLNLGGKQTNYKANEECWRVDDLTNDNASKLLCINYNNGERLTRIDKNDSNKTYKANKVCCHYSMKTLKFGVKYNILYSKNGRNHKRK